MKRWITTLLLGSLGLAQPSSQIFTFSDLHPTEPITTCPKFKGGAGEAAPAAKPAAPAPGSVSAEMQQAIAELEKEMAGLDKNSPEYQQMKGLLDSMKGASKDVASTQAAADAPGAGPVKYVKLDFKTALAATKARLEGSLSAKAWKVYQSNTAINDSGKARVAALQAMAKGNRLAVAAVLLRSVEKNPKDVGSIVNLAGVIAPMGAPNEALALLEEADRLGTQPKTAWGLNPKAIKLNARGYALLGVGKAKEAEAALKQAVSLEPQLAEAGRNLAAAQGEQGKCAEGVRTLRRSMQRTPPKETQAPPETPTPTPTPGNVALPPMPEPDTKGFKPARDVLDFSKGKKNSNWPYFVVNVDPEEVDTLKRLIAEYEAFGQKVYFGQPGRWDREVYQPIMRAIQRSKDYWGNSPSGNLSGRWVHYLMDNVSGAHNDRVLKAATQTWLSKTQKTYTDGEATSAASRQRKEESSKLQLEQDRKRCDGINDSDQRKYCYDKADYDNDVRVCQALKEWNNLWRGSISFYEKSARAYDDEIAIYYSTLTAYFSDPILQAAPRALYRFERQQLVLFYVVGAIRGHLEELDSRKEPCVRIATTPPPSAPESLGQDQDFEMPGCESNRSLKVKILILELSGNCEKAAIEVGVEVPVIDIGVFVSVEQKFSERSERLKKDPKDRYLEKKLGLNPDKILRFEDVQARKDNSSQITVFGGGKVEVGAGGNDLEGKGGFYITSGKGGAVDVGAKVESSATLGAEAQTPIGEIGVGVEFAGPESSISFVPDNGG